ncbi:DoxX family protein [Rhodobacteraceae bacterium CCMM004]|nr:DoxX family protein [Rhodobacteraceae bacterium CCMM004]
MTDWAALVGRCLLAALLLLGAAQKIADPGPAQDLLAMRGLLPALIWPAAVFNLAAGVLLAVGALTRPIAVLAAAYCAATSVFHFIPDDGWQMSIFVKNWTIAGGFLMLAAHGPGRHAVRP